MEPWCVTKEIARHIHWRYNYFPALRQKELALEYGVSTGTISQIVNGHYRKGKKP